jgi:uncharacterized protein (PEP-CTERM system associated)
VTPVVQRSLPRILVPALRRAVALAPMAAAAFLAGTAAQAQGLRVVPSFSATQVFTDNRDLSATGGRAEAITLVTPGVRISSGSGPVTGSLDYRLSGVYFSQQSQDNGFRQGLNAAVNAAVVPRHFDIAARAGISQQAVSALAAQGDRPEVLNPNRAEVRSLSIAPALRGRVLGVADLEARWVATHTRNSRSDIGGSQSSLAAISLGERRGVLGWGLSLSRNVTEFERGRKTTRDAAVGSLSYAPQPDWRFSLRAGQERTDVQTAELLASDTWGAGLEWRPGPRTQFSAQWDKRFFGDSVGLTLSHRLRRTSFSYAETRDVTERTTGAGAARSTFELFFEQFAALEPDLVLRDALVRNFLAAQGLDPDARLDGGFISQALSLQHRRNLSVGWQGARQGLVASYFDTSTRRVDTISSAVDDLSRVDLLRQHGLNVSLSHRLSPRSAMVLSGSVRQTDDRGAVRGNRLVSANLSLTGQLSRRASGSLTLRHTDSSGLNPYQENALNATLNLRF